MWEDASRKLFIFIRTGKKNFNWTFIFESYQICYILLCHDFVQTPKNGGENFFFSRFFNLASFEF